MTTWNGKKKFKNPKENTSKADPQNKTLGAKCGCRSLLCVFFGFVKPGGKFCQGVGQQLIQHLFCRVG